MRSDCWDAAFTATGSWHDIKGEARYTVGESVNRVDARLRRRLASWRLFVGCSAKNYFELEEIQMTTSGQEGSVDERQTATEP